jgi:hypothetical protein
MGQTNAAWKNDPVKPWECSPRDPDDDFFCLRYQVWYPSFDCAIRTKFKTSRGCLACEQGRFNFKRHATALIRYPFRLIAAD